MPTFEDGLTERFSAASSGAAMDLQINADGTSNYIPKDWVEIAPEDQTNPFAIQGEVTPRSVPEFAGDVAAGAGGVATGAASVFAGTPGDLVGLVKGVAGAVSAEDGQRIDTFLNTLASESESWGSEFFVQKFENLADEMLPPEYAETFKGTSDYVGQMAEIPGAIAGLAKVYGKARMAADQFIAPSGPTSRQVPTQPKVDVEATPVDTKLLYQKLGPRTNLQDLTPQERTLLEADLKTGQLDIGGSAQEIIEAAKLNQAPLVKAGEKISKEMGIFFKDPEVKGVKDKGKRLKEKSEQKGGIQQLTDVTRAGFAVRTPQEADALIQAIGDRYKIIDEGYNVTSLGYFDRKIMVINENGQVGEIQIWPDSMYDAKIERGGQDLYGLWRGKRLEEMTAKEKKDTRATAKKFGIEYDTTEELRAAARDKSVELYADALKDLDKDMRRIVLDQLDVMAREGGGDSKLAMQMMDMMTSPKEKYPQIIDRYQRMPDPDPVPEVSTPEAPPTLAEQWQSGADKITSGDVTIIKGKPGGVHTIYKDGDVIGDVSLDSEADLWVANIRGKKGQITVDSMDDVVAEVNKVNAKPSLAKQWQSGAPNIQSGDIIITRGQPGGVHTIRKGREVIGDISLDTEADLWVVNIEGKKGQITVDTIDEAIDQVKLATKAPKSGATNPVKKMEAAENDDEFFAAYNEAIKDPKSKKAADELFDLAAPMLVDSENKMLARTAKMFVRRSDKAVKRKKILSINGGNLEGVQMTNSTGTQGAIFLPDASEPGKVRVSYFDENGFYAHTTRGTYEEVLDDAFEMGFKDTSQDVLERFAKKESFSEGNKVASLIARVNEGSISMKEAQKILEGAGK